MTVKIHPDLLGFVRPSPHSKFSPSSSDKFIACPYSIQASEGIPDETSKWAEEGTLAHQVVEDYFHHKHFEMPKSNDLLMANEEMMEAAHFWLECLDGWLSSGHLGEILWYGLEKGIPIYPEEGCFGTTDFIAVGTKGCAIIDFKYGKGRAVGANATQLKTYLLGVHRYLIDIPEDYEYHAVISQPRINPTPKHHQYTKTEMDDFSVVMWDTIQTSKRTDLSPVEGSHCFWCKAKRTNDPEKKCPAIANKALVVANENFDMFLTDMAYAPENQAGKLKRDMALRKVMALKPLMDEIAKSAEEEFQFRIEQGEKIEGVVLMDKVGSRAWANDEKETATKLKELYPDLITHKVIPAKEKMKTLTAIEKEVGKKNFDASLTMKKITKKIVLDDRNIEEVLGDLISYNKIINGGE